MVRRKGYWVYTKVGKNRAFKSPIGYKTKSSAEREIRTDKLVKNAKSKIVYGVRNTKYKLKK